MLNAHVGHAGDTLKSIYNSSAQCLKIAINSHLNIHVKWKIKQFQKILCKKISKIMHDFLARKSKSIEYAIFEFSRQKIVQYP